MLRNILFQAHWFIGITAGTVLAIVGLTGAILAFEPELLRAINPAVMRVAPQGVPMEPAALLAEVQAAMPDKRIAALMLAADPRDSARVTFAADAPGRRGESRHVDPYAGTVLDKPAGEAFFRTVTQIHRYLAADKVGKHIVGASTVGLAVLALSGLYLRWPANALNWRVWLTFTWSLRGRAFWWHLHSILATWVLLLYLLAALTGLYWSYNWYRDALFSLTGAPRPTQSQGAGSGRTGEVQTPDAGRITAQFQAAGRAWELFRSKVGLYETATIRLPVKADQPVQITYLDRNPAHARAINRMVLDLRTGDAIEHERYDDRSAGSKIMSSIYALHTGRIFGVSGVIAMAIASLTLVVSGISGWLMHLDRRRKKARRDARSFARVELGRGR
jgi:sulfite reductase (NADPH) flavoprotein alpha-component